MKEFGIYFRYMRLSGQILLILGLATLCAGVQGLIQGQPLPEAVADESALSLSTALQMENALWVDARAEKSFSEAHYPGALLLNETLWATRLGPVLEVWNPGQPIIIYCDGSGCASSRKLAERLSSDLGLDPVYWLDGGWEAMEKAEVVP